MSFKQIIPSFQNAFRGIRMALRSERNMRIHMIFVILVVFFGIVLVISPLEWLICLLCFGLVLGLEMMNTAIENLVDLVSPQKQKMAGRAKDIAAGAVLLSSIVAAIIGLIIFVPKGWKVLLSFIDFVQSYF